MPRPKDVISLKWRKKSGQVEVYKLRETFSPYWKDLGKVFGFHLSLLSTFETRRREDPEQCFDDVLSEWRSNGSVPPGSYPVTWGGLIGALRGLGRMGLEVDKLSSALSNRVEEEEGAGGEGEDGRGSVQLDERDKCYHIIILCSEKPGIDTGGGGERGDIAPLSKVPLPHQILTGYRPPK